MTDKLCIYHASCMDGFGAAWAVWMKFKKKCTYLPCQYGDPIPDVLNKDVYIVGFSFSRNDILLITDGARSVTVIDHHKTAQAEIADLIEQDIIQGVFDMDHSGAVLTWDWFFPRLKAPTFLRYIEDRDLRKWEMTNSREINAAMSLYPKDFTTWTNLFFETFAMNESKLIIQGDAINRKLLKEAQHLADKAWRIEISGHDVPVVNAPGFLANDVGNILSVKEPFAATFFDMDGHRVFSLRSKDSGEDVSEIAKQYGGGGHARAAGFKVPLKVEVL